jgi:hypothetical protein
MTTSALQHPHFEGGIPVDPKAEAELVRWASSQPRLDLESIPVAPSDGPGFLGGGDIQADYYREIAEVRRGYQDDSRELARLER